MTVILRLNGTVSDPDAPRIDIPSQSELDLLYNPQLVDWRRAAPDYSRGDVWWNLAGQVPMVRRRGAWPVYVDGGLNGKPYLQQLQDQCIMSTSQENSLWPESYTFSWVGSPDEGSAISNQFIIGNADPNNQAAIGYGASGGNIIARSAGLNFLDYGLEGVRSDHVVTLSFDSSDGSYVLYIDGLSVISGETDQVIQNQDMHYFGVYSRTSGLSGASFRGRFYDLIMLSSPVHKNSALKGVLENYQSGRYGLS